MDVKFLKCEKCGSVVINLRPGEEGVCEGGPTELVAGSVDAAREKHIPVVTVDGQKVHVEVGEVPHPMTEPHLIARIVLVTKKGYQVAELTPEDAPVADFMMVEGDEAVKVYEYCNLHGLWVKEL